MARRTLGMLLILSLIIMPASVQGVRAASISIIVDPNRVSMTMTLELLENFTGLPQRHVLVDASNSTLIHQIEQPIDEAIQKLVPSAGIQDIALQARTGNVSSRMSILQENYTILINGAITSRGGAGGRVDVDLAFLSMTDSSPMLLNGMELNSVGSAYLLQSVESFPIATTNKYQFYLNGKIFLNSVIPASTTKDFDLLDFSWVPAISHWHNQYQPFDPTSRWDYSATPYNLTIAQVTPEGELYRPVVAYYQASLALVAPGGAWAEGSHVYFNIATTADLAMPLIVGATVVIGIGSYFVDRRLTWQSRARRKKR